MPENWQGLKAQRCEGDEVHRFMSTTMASWHLRQHATICIFHCPLSPPLSLFFFFFSWFVKVVWMTRKQNLFWTAICMAAKWRVVCVLDFSFLFSLIEEFIILVNLIAILRNYLLFFLFWGSLVGIGCVFGCAFFWSLLGMGWDEFVGNAIVPT